MQSFDATASSVYFAREQPGAKSKGKQSYVHTGQNEGEKKTTTKGKGKGNNYWNNDEHHEGKKQGKKLGTQSGDHEC